MHSTFQCRTSIDILFSFNVNKKKRNNRELEKEYNESRFRLKNEFIG